MNNDQEHSRFEVLTGRYLSGEISVDELKELQHLREEDPGKEAAFQNAFKAFMLVDDHLVNDMIDVDEEWLKQKQSIESNEKKVRTLPHYLRIAAAIIFAIVGVYFIQYLLSDQTVKTKQEMATLTLPDGSEVSVNAHSKIKYDKQFSDRERKVKLNGEAYFSVKRDTSRPFIVETSHVLVEVLGTAFNVEENPLKYTEVLVSEGTVRVTPKQHPDKAVILKKGETARFFDSTDEIETYKEVDENNIAWKTGTLKFRNKKLSYIIRKLNKTYQADITAASAEILDCRMTSTFDNQPLEEVLNVLAATLGLDIRYVEDQIILNGDGCK